MFFYCLLLDDIHYTTKKLKNKPERLSQGNLLSVVDGAKTKIIKKHKNKENIKDN